MQLIVLLKKKVILTLIKVVGKTLLGTTATRGQYYCNRRSRSTLNTERTNGALQLMNRVRGSGIENY